MSSTVRPACATRIPASERTGPSPPPSPQRAEGVSDPSPPPQRGEGVFEPSPPPQRGEGVFEPSPPPQTGEGDFEPSPPPQKGEGGFEPSPTTRPSIRFMWWPGSGLGRSLRISRTYSGRMKNATGVPAAGR